MMRRRAGIALVAALTLVTLLGIGVASLVAVSVSATRAVRLGQGGATTLASAEYGASTVLGDPQTYQLASLPLGVTQHVVVSVGQTFAVTVNVGVTRLPRGVLWFVADAGVAGIDSGERRVNLVAQFPNVAPLPSAGIESRGDVSLGSGVTITTDTVGDADCAARSTAPSVVTAPGAQVTAPPGVHAEARTAAGDSNSYLLTAAQRALLAAAPGVTHVAGDTTIAGGSFDGIMLVDGAVTITGPFVVNGLVVASGPIRAPSASGLIVTGSLLSAHAPPGAAFDLSAATIRFNPCVIAAFFRRATPPRRVRDRAWSELY
jgi:hypothetical protein